MPDTISPTTRAAVEKAAQELYAHQSGGDPAAWPFTRNEPARGYTRRIRAAARCAIAAYLRAQGRDSEARQVEACGE